MRGSCILNYSDHPPFYHLPTIAIIDDSSIPRRSVNEEDDIDVELPLFVLSPAVGVMVVVSVTTSGGAKVMIDITV